MVCCGDAMVAVECEDTAEVEEAVGALVVTVVWSVELGVGVFAVVGWTVPVGAVLLLLTVGIVPVACKRKQQFALESRVFFLLAVFAVFAMQYLYRLYLDIKGSNHYNTTIYTYIFSHLRPVLCSHWVLVLFA